MGTVWASIFPERFIPSSVPMTENESSVPKPKDVKPTEKFPDLRKSMAIQQLILKTGHAEILYDMYCPNGYSQANL